MQNLDANEVEKFSDLAASWWDPRGPNRLLHDINPCRSAYIAQRCELDNARVLDVGCGGGILTETLASSGALVTGIDANETLIDVAREHARQLEHPVEYRAETVETYCEQHNAEFDAVVCMELIEHVPDPKSLLKACGQCLRPHGLLVVATLSRTAWSYIGAVVTAEYLFEWLPRGTHDYAKFIRPAELARALRQLHFSVVDISGMRYNPFTRLARLSSDTRINYLLSAHKS